MKPAFGAKLRRSKIARASEDTLNVSVTCAGSCGTIIYTIVTALKNVTDQW